MATATPTRTAASTFATAIFVLVSGCTPDPDPCAEAGNICTVMGTGDMGYNGGGLPAIETWLYLPITVEFTPDGTPLIVDYNNNVIRELRDTQAVTVAGIGFHDYSVLGGDALESPLENPIDARYGPDGLLYILPAHESRLLRVGDTNKIEVVVGTGDEGYTGDGGPATLATFGQPSSFDIDDSGTIWIADTKNGALRRIGTDGVVTTALSGLGAPQRVRAEGDSIFVCDPLSSTIIRYQPTTAASEVVLDELLAPWGFEVGPDGSWYVADSGNAQILRIRDGEREVFAGTGEAGFSGDEGPATEAMLSWPSDIAIDDAGSVYITDMQNARVRKIAGDGLD